MAEGDVLHNHHTKLSGDIAELAVALDLAKRGYIVSRPLSECAPYDLICDTGVILYRIQVKFRADGAVPFKKSWSDQRGIHRKRIDPMGFDFIALVYTDLKIAYCLPT